MLWFVICGDLNLVLLFVIGLIACLCFVGCFAAHLRMWLFWGLLLVYVGCLFDVVDWLLCGYCVVYSCVFAGSAFAELVVLLFVVGLV